MTLANDLVSGIEPEGIGAADVALASISDRPSREGVLSIVAASVLWAFVYFFRKSALYAISPPLFAFLNAAIGAVSLAIICRLSLRESWKLFLCAPARFVLLGLTGVSIGTTLLTVGLDHLELGIALVLEKLQPIFTALLAALLLGERIRWKQAGWMLLALLASYFVSFRPSGEIGAGSSDVVGVAALVGAAFSWGLSSVIGRSIMQLSGDFRQTTFLRLSIGALLLIPLLSTLPAFGFRSAPDTYATSVVVLSAMLGSAPGYVLYYRGLRTVSASVSGFLELVTPVIGVLLGVLLLDERFNLIQAAAIPTMLYSVFRLTRS